MKKRVWIVCNLFVIMLALVACGKKEEVSTESIPAEQEVVTQAVSDSTESMQESVPDETADVEKPEDSQTTESDEELDEEMIEQTKEIEAVIPSSITMTVDDNTQYRYHYDNDGDMVKSETISQDGSGYENEYEYEYLLDESGNKIKGIDYFNALRGGGSGEYYGSQLKNVKSLGGTEIAITEEYTYDENNQLIRVNFPYQKTSYDIRHEDNKAIVQCNCEFELGNVIMQFNEKGALLYFEDVEDHEISTCTYNDANQIIKEEVSRPEENWTRVCEYIYDEKGNLIKEDDSIIGVTDYIYDENNNQISKKSYWTNGELYSATISEYDSNNKLLSKTIYEGAEETTFTCSYDENDNLLVISVDDQPVFEFTYDEQGRLNKVTRNENENSIVNDIAYEYVVKRTAINVGGDYLEFTY